MEKFLFILNFIVMDVCGMCVKICRMLNEGIVLNSVVLGVND